MNSASATHIHSALASVVENYEPSRRVRFKGLAAFKEEVRALRSRGAAFITIAEILKKHSIKTSRETIRRFYRQEIEQKPPRRKHSRNGNKRSQAAHSGRIETDEANAPQSKPAKTERGPRIARIEDL